MPTKREREYYRMGFQDGAKAGLQGPYMGGDVVKELFFEKRRGKGFTGDPKPKRKLSAWNKFVKANSKKSEFRYRDGKLNLKKMGVAFRRKKRR